MLRCRRSLRAIATACILNSQCPWVQIFVELERARLTRELANIKEAEGKVAEAADILQTLAVVGRARALRGSLRAQLTSAARGGGARGRRGSRLAHSGLGKLAMYFPAWR